MKPAKPQHIEQCAAACLEELAGRALGEKISLGGAFGLAYYLEYRTTRDIDAWWSQSASETDRHEVISLLQEVLCGFGPVRIRSWGDVVSIELKAGGKTVFSFQIAARPGQIEESMPAPWPSGLLLDSLRDLIAAKMVALVERGAPRDFRDIHAVCEEIGRASCRERV
jgi:hypothetical protein